jgi:cytoskeleton protein RodZ
VEATAATPEAAPPPPGAVLAEARERQGLSRAEVAQRLHMSPYQIEALEAGDYSRLPTGTFLRGFVRNYAKLLGVEPEPLLARLAEATPRAPAPGIVVPSQNIRFDPLGERLSSPYVKAAAISAVLVAIGFAALYWWFFIRPEPPAVSARKPAVEQGPPQQLAVAPQQPPQPVVPVPAPSEPRPATEPDLAAQKGGIAPGPAEPPKAEPARAEPPKVEAPKAEPKKVASARDRTLRFRFKGESWVEIRDAQDRVVFAKLNSPGSEAEYTGRPPFKVIVGNAPEVDMTYNDREFPLEPHTRVAVARFTVD